MVKKQANRKKSNHKEEQAVKQKSNMHKYTRFVVYTISVLFIFLATYNIYFSNRVLPGVYVKETNVAGLKHSELIKKVQSLEPDEDYLIVKLDNSDIEYSIPFDSVGISYNSNLTAEKAFYLGRDTFYSHIFYIYGFFKPIDNIQLEYSLNQELLNIELATLAANNFPAYKESNFYIEDNALKIREGGEGRNVDLENLKKDILTNLKTGKNRYIAKTEEFVPTITAADLEQVKTNVQDLLDSGIVLKSGRKSIDIPNEQLVEFLSFEKNGDELKVTPNISYIDSYIASISDEVNVAPKALVFNVSGDSIEFEPPVTGVELDREKSSILVEDNIKSFFNGSSDYSNSVELIVVKSKPSVDSNEYGITELIAEGESSFRGSIASRVSNIVTATNKIKGTLVAPGEEFSFNEAVGPIDARNGFNEAYVISKGRTVLGTGGGVCQVSTTVYRAALNSGLPITERSAHAYRVGYYEQDSFVGLDATIYQPSLDLKFKNDTKNYILVYSEIDPVAAYMSVKIYGTKDGRTVEVTEPKMITQIPPPAPIYEDTNELAKGVVQQVEWPAWGGTVEYSRTVKDKDGNIMYEDNFKNRYTPWPAVYKRGV